jgi:hypothetical protein
MMKHPISFLLLLTCTAAFIIPLHFGDRTSRVAQFAVSNKDALGSSRRDVFGLPIAKDGLGSSRRDVFVSIAATAVAMLISEPSIAATSQEAIDKENMVKGYARLEFLLDNWEKETIVCGMGGDNLEKRCERTPIKVMEYMGYKRTDDPLFKAEKAMRRLYSLVPAEFDSEFVDALEAYEENAEEASGMAYISSWGESNPGEFVVVCCRRRRCCRCRCCCFRTRISTLLTLYFTVVYRPSSC